MPRWPLLRVAIAGPSMEPTLHDGEWWLARRQGSVAVGDLAVLESPESPGLVIVKRVTGHAEGGWWVEGDNPTVSRDSRHFGPVAAPLVLGRLVLRYRPLLPIRALRGDG